MQQTFVEQTPNAEALAKTQHTSLMRASLVANAAVHRETAVLADDIAAVIARAATTGGGLDDSDLPVILTEVDKLWDGYNARLRFAFDDAFSAAINIGFAQLGVLHDEYMRPALTEVDTAVAQQSAVDIMDAHRDRIMSVHRTRQWFGSTLSDRIWELDVRGRAGLEAQIRRLLDGTTDPRTVITDVEKYLGANRDCPRWTVSRLDRMTPRSRAGGRGLLSGNPCESRGHAYNAVRLVRTEMQIVSHLALEDTINAMPWVERVKWVLSPLHPPIGCVCEDYAAGGRNGDGVYPKGEIDPPPAHPNCYCLIEPVLPPVDAYADRVRSWLNASRSDPALMAYTNYIGQERDTVARVSMSFLTAEMVRWLTADGEELIDLI